MPRTLLLLLFSAAALYATWAAGVIHDYGPYLLQWQLVLTGADPWSTDNAYGPLHNAFALLMPIHPLAPKLVQSAVLLVANALLVQRLAAARPAAEWLPVYLLAFGANALLWTSAFLYGNNDALVAAVVIGAVLCRLDGRMVLAGLLLGLAALDKYYPALLIPFFAMDARKVETRLILAALVTIAAGMGIGMLIWGRAFIEAVAYGVSRRPSLLSIVATLKALADGTGAERWVNILIRLNSLMVLAAWLGTIVVAWRQRDNWLVASCWSLVLVLLTYKVGHQQFDLPWVALVASLPLLGMAEADRLARLSLIYATWLSLFSLGFAVTDFYRGDWLWVKDYAGIPNLALGILLLWTFFRPASRPAS